MATKKRPLVASDPVVTIEIGKGLAARNRLPLTTLTKILIEFKNLMTAVGRDVLAARGAPKDLAPDFGLEVVAAPTGEVFTQGSVRVQIAITRNAEDGVEAAQVVLSTLQAMNRVARKPALKESALKPIEARVIPYLDRMAFIATSAKAEAKFHISATTKTSRRPSHGILGEATVKQLREHRPKPVFIEHGVVAHGKLYQLKDTSGEFAEDSTGFWGELRLDNKQRWRIQFTPGMESQVAPLFRKQVRLTGDAHYYQHRNTKLVAKDVAVDEDRDYETAFDKLWGAEKDVLGGLSFQEVLDSRYGD